MLTERYMTSLKSLPGIMQKIIDGTAPEKFTQSHLNSIGFTSSNDRAVIPLLKDLGFLSPEGAPTAVYHQYRDRSKSKKVLGAAIRNAYGDLFHIHEKPTETDLKAIQGKFKSVHNVSEEVARRQARTFLSLLQMADLDNDEQPEKAVEKASETLGGGLQDTHQIQRQEESKANKGISLREAFSGLNYSIEIHLPATKDIDVYNAIFRSLKEHLFDD